MLLLSLDFYILLSFNKASLLIDIFHRKSDSIFHDPNNFDPNSIFFFDEIWWLIYKSAGHLTNMDQSSSIVLNIEKLNKASKLIYSSDFALINLSFLDRP